MRSYLPGIYCLGVCFYTLLDHMDMFLLEPSVLSHTNSWWFPVGLLLQHRLTSALCLHERGHGSHVYVPSFSFPFLRSCCFFYTSGTLYSIRTGKWLCERSLQASGHISVTAWFCVGREDSTTKRGAAQIGSSMNWSRCTKQLVKSPSLGIFDTCQNWVLSNPV